MFWIKSNILTFVIWNDVLYSECCYKPCCCLAASLWANTECVGVVCQTCMKEGEILSFVIAWISGVDALLVLSLNSSLNHMLSKVFTAFIWQFQSKHISNLIGIIQGSRLLSKRDIAVVVLFSLLSSNYITWHDLHSKTDISAVSQDIFVFYVIIDFRVVGLNWQL